MFLTLWFTNGQTYEFIGVHEVKEDQFGNLTFNYTDRVSGKDCKGSFDLSNLAGYGFTEDGN